MYYEVTDKFKEECGVFGIFINNPENRTDAARSTFYGLYALQHRGQESAGIILIGLCLLSLWSVSQEHV